VFNPRSWHFAEFVHVTDHTVNSDTQRSEVFLLVLYALDVLLPSIATYYTGLACLNVVIYLEQ
jgi:hypothetical protein